MTLDKSLKVRAGAIKSRNVMTRAERIKRLQDLDKWTGRVDRHGDGQGASAQGISQEKEESEEGRRSRRQEEKEEVVVLRSALIFESLIQPTSLKRVGWFRF